VPEAFVYHPTAVQVEALHDTALNELPVAPLGFGVDSTDHAVPSQMAA
jgi:hypothetical protein